MKEKTIYYYSEFAASSYGYTLGEDENGNQIKFTGSAPESNPSNYDWNDKKLVGVFEPEKFKVLDKVQPKTNREILEDQFNLLNANKSPDQVIQESFEHTRNNLENERTQRDKEQVDKILAIRSLYSVVNPKPSLRFKK